MNMTEKLINKMNTTNSLILQPNIDDNKLTKTVYGINELNETIDIDVVTEKPLTIYLNSQEIVTTMTLGDMTKELSVGYLLNQNMINRKDVREAMDYDEDIDVVIVRRKRKTNYEKKHSKQKRKSDRAVGTE